MDIILATHGCPKTTMFEHFFYDEETQTLINRGLHRLAANAEAMGNEWGFGRTRRWDLDLSQNAITFTDPGLVVIAPVQFVGSLLVEDHSWVWSWANPTIDWQLTQHARLVRHYGRQRGIARFEEPRLRCTMDDAWSFTHLAAELAEAEGAYRGPRGDDLYSFMTFGQPAIFRQNA